MNKMTMSGIPIAKSSKGIGGSQGILSDAKKKARALRRDNRPVMKTGATSYGKYTKF